jgi:1-phosphofructokinase
MTPTIVTLTPNPSVDRTLEVGALRRGRVHRAADTRLDAGGKGVNVARALAANGVGTRAVLPVGGNDGLLLTSLLFDEKIPAVPVSVAAATRSNIAFAEPDGTVTKVNAPGDPLGVTELADLIDAALADLDGAAWVIGCGSLPPGAPDDLYASLVRRGHAAGVRVAVDSSGPPLAQALAAGPELVKPNLDELVELVGRPLATLDAVVAAAAEVRQRGAGAVIVSLGARGAVLVDGGDPVLARPRPIVARSDVGAGDALLAGFLAAGGAGAAALRAGVAWGSAAAALPGTEMPGPDHIDLSAVTVHDARGAEPAAGAPPDTENSEGDT